MAALDVERALQALSGSLPERALGVVLGSGLGAFARCLEPSASIAYDEIPGFPRCRVAGHAGRLHTGRIGSRSLVVFEGRVHLYEGADLGAITFPVRLLEAIGAPAVVLTCAAGAVNPDYAAGGLVIVRDQINLTGEDPARHPDFAGRAEMFPAMAEVYHPVLLDRLTGLAFALGVAYSRGVLAGVHGPSYETPAEVRALRALGADVVCMSTVLEAMAAVQLAVPVVGLALVTNRAGGVETSHERVLASARAGAGDLVRLLATAAAEIDWGIPKGSSTVRR